VLGNFLEGSVTGLNVEEVDEGQFEGEPHALSHILAFIIMACILG
jgi:hypothetical protein